ncbi:MAG: 30S ribosomal protein THX [Xanthomonadales bacterium]|nr:30S ribosomal protein THX [Xanthomonadales bacterium]
MGRGDRRTRKGKISIRSYGNARPHQARKSAGTTATKPSARPAVRKAPAKKAAPRKSA